MTTWGSRSMGRLMWAAGTVALTAMACGSSGGGGAGGSGGGTGGSPTGGANTGGAAGGSGGAFGGSGGGGTGGLGGTGGAAAAGGTGGVASTPYGTECHSAADLCGDAKYQCVAFSLAGGSGTAYACSHTCSVPSDCDAAPTGMVPGCLPFSVKRCVLICHDQGTKYPCPTGMGCYVSGQNVGWCVWL